MLSLSNGVPEVEGETTRVNFCGRAVAAAAEGMTAAEERVARAATRTDDTVNFIFNGGDCVNGKVLDLI